MMLYHLPRIMGKGGLEPSVASFLGSISYPIQYFLIVSGYGLYYAYKQNRLNWNYLFKRTTRLYISFWLSIAICVFAVGTWLRPGLFNLSPYRIVTNLIGWRWDFCQFTWFLFTYVLLTFCSKGIFKIIERLGNIASLVLTYVISIGMGWVISRYYDPFLRNNYPIYHIVLMLEMVSGFTAGAVMARIVLAGKRLTWSKLQGKNALVVLLIIIAFFLKGINNIIPVIPYFSAFIVWLIAHINPGVISKRIFVPLGNMSMMMWFLHGYIGPILFKDYYLMLKSPVLIWIVWVIISYCAARLLMPVSDYISKALGLKKIRDKR